MGMLGRRGRRYERREEGKGMVEEGKGERGKGVKEGWKRRGKRDGE